MNAVVKYIIDNPWNDQIVWEGVVRVCVTLVEEKQPIKKNRVVVISRHNIFILSNEKTSVECKINLLELETIGPGEESKEIILYFKKGRVDKDMYIHTRIYVYITIQPHIKLVKFITDLRKAIYRITHGFPTEFFNINLDSVYLEEIDMKSLLANDTTQGLVSTYHAICDLQQLKPDYEFIIQIESLFECKNRELDLSMWPSLYDFHSADRIFSVALALQYNTFFESLVIRNISCPQIADHLLPVIRNNKTIRKLVLRNIDVTWTAEFGGSVVFNEKNNICILDLSENTITDTGVAFLARSLVSISQNLTILYLSKMKLNTKEVSQILQSFINTNLARTLEALDLSYNNFDDESVDLFTKWLEKVVEVSGPLSKLNLANIGTLIGKICTALHKIPLVYLDLSKNSYTKYAENELCSMLRHSWTLKVLRLKDCDLPAETLKNILEVCSHFKDRKLQLDISRNSIGEKGAEYLSFCLCNVSCLEVLKLSHMDLGIQGTTSILDALPKGITDLIINGNLHLEDKKDEAFQQTVLTHLPALSKSLSDVLERVPSLTALSIRGSADRKLGVLLGSLIGSLKDNKTINYLDVRDHLCGPRVFSKFCRILDSSDIKVVRAEGNNLGPEGYLQARSCLMRNPHLSLSVMSPSFDMTSSSDPQTANAILSDIVLQNGLRSAKPFFQTDFPNHFKFSLETEILSDDILPESIKPVRSRTLVREEKVKHTRNSSVCAQKRPRRNKLVRFHSEGTVPEVMDISILPKSNTTSSIHSSILTLRNKNMNTLSVSSDSTLSFNGMPSHKTLKSPRSREELKKENHRVEIDLEDFLKGLERDQFCLFKKRSAWLVETLKY